MKKEFLTELNRMKDLFEYKKGQVISEQKVLNENEIPFPTGLSKEAYDEIMSISAKNKKGYRGSYLFPAQVDEIDKKYGAGTFKKFTDAGGYNVLDGKSTFAIQNSGVQVEDYKKKFANSDYSCIVNWSDGQKIEGEPLGGNIVVNLRSGVRWNFSGKGYWSQLKSDNSMSFEGNWKCAGNDNFTITSTDGEIYDSKTATWSKGSSTNNSTGTKGNSTNSSIGGSTTSKSKYTTCPETLPIKKWCKNNKIKEIQVKLGMPVKYQTGNFGPKTEASILSKIPEFKVDEGITQAILDKIMGTVSQPSVDTGVDFSSTSSTNANATQTQNANATKTQEEKPISGIN